MAGIQLEGVTKRFGADVVAVDDVSLEIGDGEFMVLVGPSGCGKSTLLRMIAGLEDVTEGRIAIGERDVTWLPARERDIAMVFQNYSLYPHMTVEQNLGFGLKLRHAPKGEIRARVVEIARILGLEELLQRKPSALSGGQRQRVAMGRAMVREPQAFLMDEPLSNLDAKLRVQMRAELARLRARLRTTTVYVTHDQVEAMTLGDRAAVLRHGTLQQLDSPQRLYREPANLFVAAFIGSPSMNLIEAVVEDGALRFAGFRVPLPEDDELRAHDRRRVVAGIRPAAFEDAELVRDDALPRIEVTVDLVEELGEEANVFFTVDAPPLTTAESATAGDGGEGEDPLLAAAEAREGHSTFTASVDPATRARPGQRLRLAVDPGAFHYFDPETGLAVGRGARAAAARV